MPVRRGRSDDDVADEAEPLTVLDLDDPEMGIRPEDRFAAIPPGPRLIPRRVHDESTRAPVVLLAALLALFVLGSWLGGVGGDESSSTTPGQVPALDQVTGATLLLVGDDGAAAIEVGRRADVPVDDPGAHALARAASERSRVVPSATTGRAWIVSAEAGGKSTAREIDLAEGTTTATLEVDGLVVGAWAGGLVVERESRAIETIGRDGTTTVTVAPAGHALGAAGNLVALRPHRCRGSDCDLVRVTDVASGATFDFDVGLSAAGTEFGSLSPDGRQLAVVRSDGIDTHGVVVDLDVGTTAPFRARGVHHDTIGPAALAWSPDGSWLFVATDRAGLDAVSTIDGTVYRVDADLPPFSAIVTR